jgi:hypothetical protein
MRIDGQELDPARRSPGEIEQLSRPQPPPTFQPTGAKQRGEDRAEICKFFRKAFQYSTVEFQQLNIDYCAGSGPR